MQSNDAEPEESPEEPIDEAAAVAGETPLRINAIRPRRRPKPWWKALFEVSTGGVAGCLVAYYALAFFLGPDFKTKGFPVFTYLPGVTWLTSPEEESADSDVLPATDSDSH